MGYIAPIVGAVGNQLKYTTPILEVKENKPLSRKYISVKNWRIRNKEKYNTYMKEFMRKKRKKHE